MVLPPLALVGLLQSPSSQLHPCLSRLLLLLAAQQHVKKNDPNQPRPLQKRNHPHIRTSGALNRAPGSALRRRRRRYKRSANGRPKPNRRCSSKPPTHPLDNRQMRPISPHVQQVGWSTSTSSSERERGNKTCLICLSQPPETQPTTTSRNMPLVSPPSSLFPRPSHVPCPIRPMPPFAHLPMSPFSPFPS